MGLRIDTLLKGPHMPRMATHIVATAPKPDTDPLSLPTTQLFLHTLIGAADQTRRRQRNEITGGRHLPTFTELTHKNVMEIGHRIANGVRLSLLNTQYGKWHHNAREDARTKDHGFEHDRRHFKWVRALIEHGDGIKLSLQNVLLAIPLVSPNHDANQLDISYHNTQLPKEDRLKPKDAHDWGGALQVLAYRKRYAEEAYISEAKAREVVGLASAMILFHDDPVKLALMQEQTAISHGRKAYSFDLSGQRYMLHGQALIDRVEEGCDVLSLSPRQIAELTRYYKTKADPRFITSPDSFGLDQRFEDDFADELQRVYEDDMPLVEPKHITPLLRREFLLANKITVLADQLDMVVPFGEGMLRMFPLEISRTRPLFEPNIRERVLGNEGNPGIDSDLGRKLWEIRTLADRIADPELLKSATIRKIIADVQVKALLELKKIGVIFMKGDLQQARELITIIQLAQLPGVADKMAQKAKIGKIHVNSKSPAIYATTIADTMEASTDPEVQEMGQRLHAKIRELTNGIENIINGITDERKNGTAGLIEYSQEDIHSFENLCDELIEGSNSLQEKGIRSLVEIHTPKLVKRLRREFEGGKGMRKPYTSHSSTQTFQSAKVRTWSEKPQLILNETRLRRAVA